MCCGCVAVALLLSFCYLVCFVNRKALICFVVTHYLPYIYNDLHTKTYTVGLFPGLTFF